MKRLSCILLLTIAFAFCVCNRQARQDEVNDRYDYYVQVVGVSDGDTFKGLTQDNKELRFRVYGIDAPEKRQAFGERSKQYLSDLIYGRRVGITVQKKNDGWGRPVVWVYTPDGKDVAAEMLKAGMAWHFKRYSDSEVYEALEDAARKERIGLWSDKEPVAPWEYRKKK